MIQHLSEISRRELLVKQFLDEREELLFCDTTTDITTSKLGIAPLATQFFTDDVIYLRSFKTDNLESFHETLNPIVVPRQHTFVPIATSSN